jgi:hypothetical protein
MVMVVEIATTMAEENHKNEIAGESAALGSELDSVAVTE